MSTIAFDQMALTRIADFARPLTRLHQLARRQWIDDFDTLEEARAAYPEAEVQVSHSLYRPPYLGHLPQED